MKTVSCTDRVPPDAPRARRTRYSRPHARRHPGHTLHQARPVEPEIVFLDPGGADRLHPAGGLQAELQAVRDAVLADAAGLLQPGQRGHRLRASQPRPGARHPPATGPPARRIVSQSGGVTASLYSPICAPTARSR